MAKKKSLADRAMKFVNKIWRQHPLGDPTIGTAATQLSPKTREKKIADALKKAGA